MTRTVGPLDPAHLRGRLEALVAATRAEQKAAAAVAKHRADRDAVLCAMYYEDKLSLAEMEAVTGLPETTVRLVVCADPRHDEEVRSRRRRRHPRLPAPTELPPPPFSRDPTSGRRGAPRDVT